MSPQEGFAPVIEDRGKDLTIISLVIINYNGQLYSIEVKKKNDRDVGDIRVFRFTENNETYQRGNGAVICTNDSVVPLTKQDSIVPFYYI